MITTPNQLKSVLIREFPIDTNCWSCATDEVRDLSRAARERLGLGEEYALDFRKLTTPSQWNTQGIDSIIRFYSMMDDANKKAYLEDHALWFDHWFED